MLDKAKKNINITLEELQEFELERHKIMIRIIDVCEYGNLDDLKSDSSYRDRYIKNKTLETNTYKYAKFIPTEAIGMDWPLPISETIEFKLIGDMTIKTTTKRLTWIIKCSNNGSNLIGKATTEFTFEDFNITKPSAMSVVSVEDEIRLEIDFEATIDQ